MDIDVIKTFISVYRLRHFGRTAKELNITSAAVSARIKQLENETKTPLFYRHSKEVKPTAAGNELLKHADAILLEWKKISELGNNNRFDGRLNIGIASCLHSVPGRYFFEQLIIKNNDLQIFFEASDSDRLVQKLSAHRLDLAFLLETPSSTLLTQVPLGVLKLRLVHSIKDQSITDLNPEHYIKVDWGHLDPQLNDQIELPDLNNARINLSQPEIAYSNLNYQTGFALLPEQMVREDVAKGDLHWVEQSPVFEKNLYAVFTPRTTKRLLIKSCMTLMRNSLLR